MLCDCFVKLFYTTRPSTTILAKMYQQYTYVCLNVCLCLQALYTYMERKIYGKIKILNKVQTVYVYNFMSINLA